MKLALRELRRRPGRFATATVILTLIAALLMLLGGLLDGLLRGATSAVLAQPGQLVVYSSMSENSFPRSRIDADVAARVADVDGVAEVGGLGVVQLGVSYWLYARAIKHVTALEAVLIPVIEPILNPVWVFLAQHERPTPSALLGGGIVLGAVTLRALASVRAGRRSAMAVPAEAAPPVSLER